MATIFSEYASRPPTDIPLYLQINQRSDGKPVTADQPADQVLVFRLKIDGSVECDDLQAFLKAAEDAGGFNDHGLGLAIVRLALRGR